MGKIQVRIVLGAAEEEGGRYSWRDRAILILKWPNLSGSLRPLLHFTSMCLFSLTPFACVCVLKLNLNACNLERGSTLCDREGLSLHLNVNTTGTTPASSVRPVFFLYNKHLFGASVECCNFLFKKSDIQCFFCEFRCHEAVILCVNGREHFQDGLV